jgi:DNA-binding LytR/AlgR family response regulator
MLSLFDFAVGFVISTVVYFYIKSDALSILLQNREAPGEPLLSFRKFVTGERDTNLIRLSGKTKDAIMLNPCHILYIESSGNYAEIHFLEDGKESKRTLRTTILQLENALKEYPSIVRCHRAFIVNIAHVEKVSAFRQGFLLGLKSVEKAVPVSKTYKKNLLPVADSQAVRSPRFHT